jgi:predicted flap endonuclease-1-like 5' DNA nuclease
MWFIISHYWVAILLALGLGLIVGYFTCNKNAALERLNRWGFPALVATGVGILIAWMHLLPGRLGLWLETLLLTFITYIVGCLLGTYLKRWMANRPEVMMAAPVAAAAIPNPVMETPVMVTPAVVKHAEVTPTPVPVKVVPAPQPVVTKTVEAAPAVVKPVAAKPFAVAKVVEAPQEPTIMAKVAGEDDHAGKRPVGYVSPRGGKADDLKLLKGIAKTNEDKLHALGIWHFDQLANWTKEETLWVGSYLAFPGRIERENWIEQAKLFAKGGETEHSKAVKAGLDQSSKPKAKTNTKETVAKQKSPAKNTTVTKAATATKAATSVKAASTAASAPAKSVPSQVSATKTKTPDIKTTKAKTTPKAPPKK